MTRRQLSEEFKREAVHLVTTRGVSAAQAARDLDLHSTVLRRWVREAENGGGTAFPGHGRMPPDDEELRGLRREVAKLKAERDILKIGEPTERQWSERHWRAPTSPGTNCDVRVRGEAPRDLACQLDVRSARCFAERIPRVAHTAA